MYDVDHGGVKVVNQSLAYPVYSWAQNESISVLWNTQLHDYKIMWFKENHVFSVTQKLYLSRF